MLSATTLSRVTAFTWVDALAGACLDLDVPDDERDRVLGQCPLAIGVLDLRARMVLAMSERLGSVLGVAPDDVGSIDLTWLVDDPARLPSLLDLVADGSISAYEVHRPARSPSGALIEADHWITTQGRHTGRALWLMWPQGLPTELPAPLRRPPEAVSRADQDQLGSVVVGVMDTSWRVEHISIDDHGVLGLPAHDVVGQPLLDSVHPDDVVEFISASARALALCTTTRVELRLGTPDNWTDAHLVLTPIVDVDLQLAFAVVPITSRDSAGRARSTSRLEQHLWRIAQEIEASGIAPVTLDGPDLGAIPQLAGLSDRQWEIVRLLQDGARVPTIARELYLSPSTVRNHLSAIFAKVGVHSQEELLQVLRSNGHNV